MERAKKQIVERNPSLAPAISGTQPDAWGRAVDIALYRIQPEIIDGRKPLPKGSLFPLKIKMVFTRINKPQNPQKEKGKIAIGCQLVQSFMRSHLPIYGRDTLSFDSDLASSTYNKGGWRS